MERSKESFDVQLSGCRTRNKIATISGGNDGEDPPVPIPNTEVKLSSAESTWLDTAREDKSLPDSYLPLIQKSQGRFFRCFEEVMFPNFWVGLSYYTDLLGGFQRAMETDEVRGRPMESFAVASHAAMWKMGLGGTDEGLTRGHCMQTSPTHSRERESRGSKTLWWGQGAKPLGLSPLVKKEKYFCKSSRNFRRDVEIYKHKDQERT